MMDGMRGRDMDERRLFVQYMRSSAGRPAPAARVLLIQPPLDDSGDTDCWTHATRYAAATGATYVEGICHLPPREDGRPRVAAHAWCEEDSPFGRRVVEFTEGYEQAFDYVGVEVPTDTPQFARAEHDGHRYSVIELDIAIAMQIPTR